MKIWQKCPKCDGQGRVSKPPYISGDQQEWSSSAMSYTCNVCSGTMIIPTPDQYIDIKDLIISGGQDVGK